MLNNVVALLGTGAAASTTSFESIATVTVGAGGASSAEFTSIPSTYTHLQIRGIRKGGDNIELQFNSDTGSNYKTHYLYGSGSSAASGAGAGSTSILVGRMDTNQFGSMVADILDYTNTNKYKTTRSLTGWDNNGSGEVFFESGVWMNTNAVTSIKLIGTFNQYSSFALYGIKGA